MFAGVWTFEKQRSPLQAVGFYLAHFGISFSVAMSVSLMLGINSAPAEGAYEAGVQVGTALAIVYSAMLGFLVTYKKADTGTAITVAIIAAIAAYNFGFPLGGVPAAYMTTRPSADRDT